MAERPSTKVPIPGTDGWFRVTTTHGNVFYAQKGTKRSEWIVPEEIREQVEAMNGRKKRCVENREQVPTQVLREPETPAAQAGEHKNETEHQYSADTEVNAALKAASDAAAEVHAVGGEYFEGEEEEEDDDGAAISQVPVVMAPPPNLSIEEGQALFMSCLLYTSDAADE